MKSNHFIVLVVLRETESEYTVLYLQWKNALPQLADLDSSLKDVLEDSAEVSENF